MSKDKDTPSPHAGQMIQSDSLTSMKKSLLEKYGNTPYAALIENNPYSQIPNLPYKASKDFWNDMYSSYEKSAAEYYAQIQQVLLEQEYNSESAKAQRLRAAGINPDLQGLGEASEASPFDMPMASPTLPSSFQSTGQGLNIANSIFDSVQGVLASAMSFAQGIEQYRGRQYENFNLALSNKENLMNKTLDQVVKGLPVDWTNPVSDEDLSKMFLEAAKTVGEDRTVPKRIRRAWSSAISMWSRDPQSNKLPLAIRDKFEGLRKSYAQNRNEAFKIFGNGFFNADDETMLSNFYDSIGKYSTEIEELKSQYNQKKLKLDLDYLRQSDQLNLPQNRAIAENSGYNSANLHNQNVAAYEGKVSELGLPSDSASAASNEAKAKAQQALYAKTMSEILNKSIEWKKALAAKLDKNDSLLGSALKGALPTFFDAVDSWISWMIPNPDKAASTLGQIAGLL